MSLSLCLNCSQPQLYCSSELPLRPLSHQQRPANRRPHSPIHLLMMLHSGSHHSACSGCRQHQNSARYHLIPPLSRCPAAHSHPPAPSLLPTHCPPAGKPSSSPRKNCASTVSWFRLLYSCTRFSLRTFAISIITAVKLS